MNWLKIKGVVGYSEKDNKIRLYVTNKKTVEEQLTLIKYNKNIEIIEIGEIRALNTSKQDFFREHANGCQHREH
jgi:hypothetical protein